VIRQLYDGLATQVAGGRDGAAGVRTAHRRARIRDVSDVVLVALGAVLGFVIGMLGGGGGIVAVPLLVAAGETVLSASTMSLVVVGVGAAAALVPHARAGRVDWPIGLTFGALGAVGAVIGALLAGHIPAGWVLGGLAALLLIGAVTMLRAGRTARREAHDEEHRATMHDAASDSLLRDGPHLHGPAIVEAVRRTASPRTIALASGVGLVTGIFGVGAGFIVVPALVAAMRVPIKKATATALVVIVINSTVAFAARAGNLRDVHATLVLAALTAAFAVIGALVSRRVPAWILSTAFGTLMLAVATYTLVKAASL
jgi:uncharacterized membrane protein YfcA